MLQKFALSSSLGNIENMSKLLLLYGYNNYFNRIMKRESTLADYKAKVGAGFYVELDSTNFNVTDGVNARHIFNVSSFLDEKSPDYLVREVTKTIEGQTTNKLERWFVLESVKIMGNQIQLSLRRDMIADYYDEIKVAPAYIQKGMLPYESPLVFNKEGLTFNEIKTKEYLLKDSTKCSWIVGYLARSLDEQEHDDCIGEAEAAKEATDFEDLPERIQDIINNGTANILTELKLHFSILNDGPKQFRISENIARTNVFSENYSLILPCVKTDENIVNEEIIEAYNGSDFKSVFLNYVNNSIDERTYFDLQNKLINKDGKTYRIKISSEFIRREYSDHLHENELYITPLGRQFDDFIEYLERNFEYQFVARTGNPTICRLDGTYFERTVSLEEVDFTKVKVNIPLTRNSLYDAPYDMFAIPMGSNIKVVSEDTPEDSFDVKGNIALPLARGIKLEFGTACYDVQILPFCPFKDVFDTNNPEHILIDDLEEGKDFNYIKSYTGNEKVSIILFPHRSNGTYDIDVSEIEEFNVSPNVIERKIAAETIKARLVSPNYSGSFDFNPQKNEGVGIINVDYNCKPYTPYIHVSPIFSGLYGVDTNDARGLICGGDFSITVAASQWEEYQIQNKNFENIFDRQIQNMDVNNSIAMEKAKYTATIGTVSAGLQGASGGAITGNIIGGPGGAIAGAVIGGVASAGLSAAAGLKDVELLGKQQSENRDYAVDMYTYQLGNIQALPYTLTKVSTYNENNKIFPFIEIYDCTDVEKQNLRDKIKYNGMTVMVEGKIEDYVFNEGDYIQAQLIRLEGIYEDNHMIVEIYNELMKGIYIYG